MAANDTEPCSEITVFAFEGCDVRTVTANSEPWFVAADVARILGYRDAANASRMLDDDMRGTQIVSTPGGDQHMAVISEPGLYRLIMRSQRPEARAIERWVVAEVLPAIRRTGSYSGAPATPSADVAALDRRALAMMVIEAEDARVAAEARVAELEPAADAWARMVETGGHLSLTAAAKVLQSSGARVKAREFFLYLHEKRWTYRAGGVGDWTPYAEVMDAGLMTTRLVTDHDGKTKPQARVTVLGMEKLRALLIGERGDGGSVQTSLQLVVTS